MSEELTVTGRDPFQVTTMEEAIALASKIAESGMCGLRKPAQVITLMKLASDDRKTLAQVMREQHVFEDGKIAQKANFTQGSFQAAGNTIIFHVRTDEMVAATFIMGKADTEARKRAIARFKLLWELDAEEDPEARTELQAKIADLSFDGEETIIRTRADAIESGIALNSKGDIRPVWMTSKRQMLTARCVTEGINVVDPARAAGLYSEDEVVQIQVQEQKEAKAHVVDMTPAQRLEWEISEKMAKAELAGSPGARSQLLGEAAEARTKLAELQGDNIDLTPKNQPTTLEGATNVAPVAPVTATTKAGVKNKPEAELGLTVEPPKQPDWRKYVIKMVKTPAYKGKTLETFDKAELEILHRKRSVPYLEANDKELRTEAKIIELAYNEVFKK